MTRLDHAILAFILSIVILSISIVAVMDSRTDKQPELEERALTIAGVECIFVKSREGSGLSCNWDKYNGAR